MSTRLAANPIEPVAGGVVAAKGFVAAGVAAGIKGSGKRDVALVASEAGAVPAAACFTTNLVAAAPVLVSREHIADGRCAAVIINAGGANACTGERGLADARTMAATTGQALQVDPSDVLVCSTGVIGEYLPMDRIAEGVTRAAASLSASGGADAAEAIMTTDTVAKQAAVRVRVAGVTYTVGGMAKGSGMIAPNMATMLAVVTTDAPLDSAACSEALASAVRVTFNRVTVDSDTSTNDTVVLMASGAASGEPIGVDDPRFDAVAEAVRTVCSELSRLIARDGEGATKLVTVAVTGAASEDDAERAARTIAESPLVKTAVWGEDANWGRVAAAAGRSGARFDAADLAVTFAGIPVCVAGMAVGFDEEAAAEALAADEIEIEVALGAGDFSASVLTCDLTEGYVRINGEYRS